MRLPLPRYTDQTITHDPLEAMLAQRQAAEQQAREAIAQGHTPQADPADLRGIPCIARGTSGTSPGTNPAAAVLALDNIRHPRGSRSGVSSLGSESSCRLL